MRNHGCQLVETKDHGGEEGNHRWMAAVLNDDLWQRPHFHGVLEVLTAVAEYDGGEAWKRCHGWSAAGEAPPSSPAGAP